MYHLSRLFFFFFFNDTATTEIYTLSLHDALPIYDQQRASGEFAGDAHDRLLVEQISGRVVRGAQEHRSEEPRLNSSHSQISYAVFCLKKKKKHSALSTF